MTDNYMHMLSKSFSRDRQTSSRSVHPLNLPPNKIFSRKYQGDDMIDNGIASGSRWPAFTEVAVRARSVRPGPYQATFTYIFTGKLIVLASLPI